MFNLEKTNKLKPQKTGDWPHMAAAALQQFENIDRDKSKPLGTLILAAQQYTSITFPIYFSLYCWPFKKMGNCITLPPDSL